MAAGTAYSKRYGAGFVDKPTLTTPIDSAFLNAVEAALLQLIGAAPTVDGQVQQWDFANTRFGPALLLNKNIDPAAAIDKSKLNLAGQIVNADIAGAAAISRSKLDFGSGLVNADIASAAAIVASKLAGYPTDATKSLRGDGGWTAGSTELIFDVQVARGQTGDPATGATVIDSNTILGGNLPTKYRHLLIEASVRGNAAGVNDNLQIRFNADSGGNYYQQWWYDGNATLTAGGPTGAIAQGFLGYTAGDGLPASTFSTYRGMIALYGASDRKKIVSNIFDVGDVTAANALSGRGWMLWNSTAAATRLQFGMNAMTNQFKDGSRLTLLGVL